MPKDSHSSDHVDRRQIVLHEIPGAHVQNVQIADRIQLLLRSMQSRDWTGAFRDMRAEAAQVHRVAQPGILRRLRDRVALSLLLLTRSYRRQHQVRSACTVEGLGKRSRIGQMGRERFRAVAYEAL